MKAKKEQIKTDDYQIDFIPGEKGSLKEAYVRFEIIRSDANVMSLDNDNLEHAVKVRDWLTKIIDANKTPPKARS